MYFAGLNLNLSHAQGIESMVCLTVASQFVLSSRQFLAAAHRADSEGGAVVKMPASLTGRIATFIHSVTALGLPLVCLGSVLFNGLEQPAWMERWRLPYEIGIKEEALARTAACVAAISLSKITGTILNYLGKQFHYIGVREKPGIVSTGPYAIVRHPLYTMVLAHQAIYAVMFWSYLPIIVLGATAVAFAVKIPIEEKLILDSPTIGHDYVQYQKQVPFRLIPYIW